MDKKYRQVYKEGAIITSLVILGVVLFSCSATRSHGLTLFNIRAASYQSWMISEEEKGVDIFIEFRYIDPLVTIDSVVFRGSKVSLVRDAGYRHARYIGTVSMGIPLIVQEQEPSHKEASLIYRYLGNRYEYPLARIDRKETQFVHR